MAGSGTGAGIELGLGQIREAAGRLLALLGGAEVGDRGAAALSLEVAASLGVAEQAAHGLRLQVLAQADRLRAVRGGIGPWLATRQGQSNGRARTLAQDARLLATVPQVGPELASGELSAGAVRLLARTVKACKNTAMDPGKEVAAALKVVRAEGVSTAADHVRALERRLDPGKVKNLNDRQRRHSQARAGRLENGMWRFEVLLDPARAAVLNAAVDAVIGSSLRSSGGNGGVVLPPDVKSAEQITAHAFHRIAEVFLAAPSRLRRAAFSAPVLFFAPLPGSEDVQDPTSDTAGKAAAAGEEGVDGAIPVGCALSAYGDVVPLSAVGPVQGAAVHLAYTDRNGQAVLLDGEVVDWDPDARPASAAQRIAMAYRERVRTLGSSGPATRSLDARHLIPHSQGGQTRLRNLASLCGEHHVTTRHPDAR